MPEFLPRFVPDPVRMSDDELLLWTSEVVLEMNSPSSCMVLTKNIGFNIMCGVCSIYKEKCP